MNRGFAAVLSLLMLLSAGRAPRAEPLKSRRQKSRAEEKARIEQLKISESADLERTSDRHERARIRRRYKLLRKEARAAARAQREGPPSVEEDEPQKMLK